MRKYVTFLLVIIILVLSLEPRMPVSNVSFAQEKEFRACWVSYIDIEKYLKDLTKEQFENAVEEMYDRIMDNGMNVVMVHVHAMGDSIYESEYFCFSKYVASETVPSYDPLKLMLELAHEKGLLFIAWLNPYRLSIGNETTEIYKQGGSYEKYKEFTITYSNADGEACMALDPASRKTIDLIKAYICELLDGYAVDGIFFDDYFYESGMSDVPEAEKKKNVNVLVKEVYTLVKEKSPEASFGISPAGNIQYAMSIGADVDTWLSQEGYVDYLIPQIYWTDEYIVGGHKEAMFSDRCASWKEKNKAGKPLYVGLALYKSGVYDAADVGWSVKDNNLSQQYATAKIFGYGGYAMFRYEWLLRNEACAELEYFKGYVGKAEQLYEGNAHVEKHTPTDAAEAVTEEQVTGVLSVEGSMAYSDFDTGENAMDLGLLAGDYVKLAGEIFDSAKKIIKIYILW